MRQFKATSSTYVSPNPEPAELDPLMERALTQSLERDVLVPLLQNVCGGFGVFVALLAWRLYHDTTSNLLDLMFLPAVVGAVLFGAATAYRAFRDEVQEALYHRARGWAEGRTNKDLDFLEEEVDRLRMENRQLSAQMAQMVKNIRTSSLTEELPQGKPRPIEDEYTEPLRDALWLCRFHDDHHTIARDKAMNAGMTRNRWDAARRLLVDSGVPVNGSVFGVPVVVAMSYVREFVEKQRRMPAGFVTPNED